MSMRSTTARRGLGALGAALALSLALTACGDGSDAFAAYDPVEVEMLRKQGERSGFEVTDELLLETLRTRDDCRTIKAVVDAVAKGEKSGPAFEKFAALPKTNEDRGQPQQADHFRTLADEVELGDVRQTRDYHVANCAGVK
ncbi:hypothetical protein [Streptomyces sp. NPDC096068]|uniref:hypothetical protein n=1 Tax=Streptomyces sp. NPDC096068 TaxID=3155424 RepID=UPI00332417E2